MRPPLLSLASVLFLVPSLAHAASGTEQSLVRTRKWEINYDQDLCHLRTRFGSGKQATIISLTRYSPAESFDLAFYGKTVESRSRAHMMVEIGFGAFAARRMEGIVGTGGNDQPLLLLNGLGLRGAEAGTPSQSWAALSLEQERAITFITLKGSFGRNYRFETGPMDKPMAAMRSCLSDLVASWGYDPAQQASALRPALALTSPASWLRSGDYPTNALLQGHNGLVQFRLDLDASGAVSGCRVLYRTNPDDFADLTCKILTKRARFSPALDSSGKPMRSYFVSKVHFRMG